MNLCSSRCPEVAVTDTPLTKRRTSCMPRHSLLCVSRGSWLNLRLPACCGSERPEERKRKSLFFWELNDEATHTLIAEFTWCLLSLNQTWIQERSDWAGGSDAAEKKPTASSIMIKAAANQRTNKLVMGHRAPLTTEGKSGGKCSPRLKVSQPGRVAHSLAPYGPFVLVLWWRPQHLEASAGKSGWITMPT